MKNQVLVVDDEADIRELLSMTLSRMGLETHCAASTGEAFALLETNSYDLCLTDMRLPDGDGLGVLDHVAKHYPSVPVAVITRPGAASRRGELPGVERALAPYRELRRIQAPATLDGGDVLRVGKRIFVGRTARSNAAGIDQLRDLVAAHGYSVEGVAADGCLHLKSGVTALGDNLLLINRQWVDPAPFTDLTLADVDPAEPFAANVLRIGDRVVMPGMFVRTRERVESLGLHVSTVPADELAKAEGGVTCCSLILSA